MKILLVDDHILFREGLAGLIDSQPDLTVVGSADSVEDAVAKACALKPDLILMDFGLPDGTGLDATHAILKEFPDVKIVFLTMHENDERLLEALHSGAKGYLLKNSSVSQLLSFIRNIQRGETAIPYSTASRLLVHFAQTTPLQPLPPALERLTAPELEVLQELNTGASNRQISDRLVISEQTVKNHVNSILSKLELKNRHDATYFARRHGLIDQ